MYTFSTLSLHCDSVLFILQFYCKNKGGYTLCIKIHTQWVCNILTTCNPIIIKT